MLFRSTLLAASGVTAKQLSGVKFSYDQSSDFGEATAKFVADQLKTNLGVDVTLEPLDGSTLSGRLDVGGFQIAGPDGKYVAATARIDGATVLVSSPDVLNPSSVRYAWDYNPDANLVNELGLPASLFRTNENDDRQ